ncbi:hypothetical protein Tco_0778347 [Tanacetum coccineum]
MENENHIRTLGDYSKPSHEGYRNTIEIPDANNVVPLRSDTIRLVQNGCSFNGLRESLSKAWTRFKDLLQNVPRHGINRWIQIQIFYDHVSFHLKYEIDRAAGGKLHHKNIEESWEIIEDLALYDHEGWNDSRDFVKPVKAVSTSQIRDYMAAHTEIMERFENAIFKQRGEINDRMTEMFRPLKELTASRTLEKVLIREEARYPITIHINSISLIRLEEKENVEGNEVFNKNVMEPDRSDAAAPLKEVDKMNRAENRTKSEPVRSADELVEAPSSQNVGYHLKHKINEKLIEGLIKNQRFNDSLSATRVGNMKRKTYDLLPMGPMHDAILKKKIPKKRTLEEILKYRLTDETPVETDIRLSLASHSYIYPLGIAEDVLVEVVGYVYCNTPKLGRSGIRVWGVLLQDQ